MTTDGRVGHVPEWYDLIQAAKYLGVAPWDLLERPTFWTSWARLAAKAENEAAKQRAAARTRKAKVK